MRRQPRPSRRQRVMPAGAGCRACAFRG